jgi:dynein heavy chain
MVSACKQYITQRGSVRVWDVDPNVLLERINTCQQLYQRYQECFHQGKLKIQAGSRPFEISEMYVFGKFSSFSRRMEGIKVIVNVVKEYSGLKFSRIEGIEPLINKFNHIMATFKKKPYSPLDHRKMEFTLDYQDFKRQIAELGEELGAFMRKSFEKVVTCMQTLQLLKRYDTMAICAC